MMHIVNTLETKKKERSFLINFGLITLFAYQFYQGAFMNAFLLKICNTLLVLFLIVYLFRFWSKSKPDIPYYNLMRYLTFSVFITLFTAALCKDQNISYTFTIMARMDLLVIIFFLLWKWKPDINVLEKYILLFGIVYIVLWLYAMWRLPEITFGNITDNSEISDSRGIARINFVGRGNLIIAYFLCLNRFKISNNWKWLLAGGIFFLFIVFQVTRQLILFPMLIGVIYLLWNKPRLCIIMIILSALFWSFIESISFSDDSIIGSMLSQTDQQLENQQSGGEDIRVTEYKFFLFDWHESILTMIFGTGMPHGASKFGQWYINSVMGAKHIYLSDVGYAAMYALQGLVGVFLYLYLYFKAAFQHMPKHLVYIRLWFIFVIPANVAAQWYNKPDFIVISVICLYIMGLTLKQKQISRKNGCNNYCQL